MAAADGTDLGVISQIIHTLQPTLEKKGKKNNSLMLLQRTKDEGENAREVRKKEW